MPQLRYAMAALFGLLPTVFAVAYEQVPRGVDVGHGGLVTWLPPVAAVVLFWAVESVARLWQRMRALSIVLVPVALLAAGVWWRSMAGLGVFLDAGWVISLLAPTVYVAMFAGVGLAIGVSLARESERVAPKGRSDHNVPVSR